MGHVPFALSIRQLLLHVCMTCSLYKPDQYMAKTNRDNTVQHGGMYVYRLFPHLPRHVCTFAHKMSLIVLSEC